MYIASFSVPFLERTIIVGDADYCVEKLKKVEESGIKEVIIYFDFGGLAHNEAMVR